MTIWLPDLEGAQGPRYQAIADAIGSAVDSGDLTPGDRLPPQRELAWKLGVTVGTVSRAYTLAEQRGFVTGEVGRGTFVQQRPQSAANLIPPASPLPFDMGINIAPTAGQARALEETLKQISGDLDASAMVPYAPPAGLPAHRQAVAGWLARAGLDVGADDIVLTCGAQHGLAMALSALAAPGETVLSDALTYPGVIDMARLFRLNLEPVALDGQGMVPDALDRAARQSRARLVCLNPTVHNPTNAMMGPARRAEIAEIARRHDLTVIEDNVYGWLVPDQPDALATLIPERTVFISSASKSFAPGLRAGWIAAPPELVRRLTAATYATAVCQPPLMHEIAARWITDGTAAALVESLRAEVGKRQALAQTVLDGLQVDGYSASFHILIHLPPPWRGAEFAEAAVRHGIRVVPASTFAVGQTAAPHAIRASITAVQDRGALRTALGRLRDLAFSNTQIRGVI